LASAAAAAFAFHAPAEDLARYQLQSFELGQ